MVKNLHAMWETSVQSLGWEDPLEEGMAWHSSIFAWRIPMDRRAWQTTVCGITKSRTQLSDFTFTFTVSDFIFGGSKITADGDCSHEIKGHLLLGRKVMTNLDSIFKSERYHFAEISQRSA